MKQVVAPPATTWSTKDILKDYLVSISKALAHTRAFYKSHEVRVQLADSGVYQHTLKVELLMVPTGADLSEYQRRVDVVRYTNCQMTLEEIKLRIASVNDTCLSFPSLKVDTYSEGKHAGATLLLDYIYDLVDNKGFPVGINQRAPTTGGTLDV